MKTYNDLYLTTRNTLKRSGVEAYAQEARILVACAAGKTVAQLLRDLNLYTTPAVENTVTDYLARRLRGEPVAYITGTWEFYGLPMKVNTDVLNVRKAPSTSSAIATTVRRNEVYTIVEESGGWGRLKSGAGWISLDYCSKTK